MSQRSGFFTRRVRVDLPLLTPAVDCDTTFPSASVSVALTCSFFAFSGFSMSTVTLTSARLSVRRVVS